jgi:GNAT superfamily N-acetyltransferase
VSITYRRGTPADASGVLDVLVEAMADLNRRESGPDSSWAHPATIRDYWTKHQRALDYVTRTAEQHWIADHDGQVVGYARTILHDGVRELTEFMVLPAEQSAGIGRELLTRAFPAEGARRRTIFASSDSRALARYLKSGVYPRFVVKFFSRTPAATSVETDLTFEPVAATADMLAAFATIDRAVLDSTRDAIHAFLLSDRQGYLYRRGAHAVGYGYVGDPAGPFALLDASDFPAVLAHAESVEAGRGAARFVVGVPMINRAAITYLLARNFRFDEGGGFCMSDEPFGKFDQYIVTDPPLFI